MVLLKFIKQDNLYTVILRGIMDGATSVKEHIISCIEKTTDPFTQIDECNQLMSNEDLRFIILNTTEAVIVYSDKYRFDDVLPNIFSARRMQIIRIR